jgi:hypothetical protein
MVGKRSWGTRKRRHLAGSAPGMGEVEPRYVAPWPGIHEMIVTNLGSEKCKSWVNPLD